MAIGQPHDPRAAYVHVPFCRRRCGYCNFTLVADRDDLIGSYLRALEMELALLNRPHEVDTVFIGGGTPSHLDSLQLTELFALIDRWFPLATGGEFSIEANPEDCDEATIDACRSGGVTRISLGVQSFQSKKLKALERTHSASQIDEAISLARDRGIDISLDLIFAAPNETLAQWGADLQQAIDRRPDHISTYGLTFDQGAAFWSRKEKGALRQASEELEARMYETSLELLGDAGFEHYEVSNFARSGKRCRHNETYWRGRSYFAAGPGAARYVDGRRECNHRSTTTYLKRVLNGESPVAEVDEISPEARARERFAFGLRMLEGVNCVQFADETGFDVWTLLREPLERYLELRLLEAEGDQLRLTRQGLMISDSILADLF